VHRHCLNMRRITREELALCQEVVEVEMPYAAFVAKFGEKHADHPPDWDAPGPVELWFFALPWGQRIALEYHLAIGQFTIHLEVLEIDAVLDYLELRDAPRYLHQGIIELLKSRCPRFFEGLGTFHLYRQDDNGNKALMRSYESRRVADYYQKQYEDRGHRQLYWVEPAHAEL